MISTNSPEEIGRKIRLARRKKDMSQEDLANQIGVTRATINKYEAGVVNFPRTRIEQLSKALDVSPSYLLGWDNEYSRPTKKPLFEVTDDAEKYDALQRFAAQKQRLADLQSQEAAINQQRAEVSLDRMESMSSGDVKKYMASTSEIAELSMEQDQLHKALIIAQDDMTRTLVELFSKLSMRDKVKLLEQAYNMNGDE